VTFEELRHIKNHIYQMFYRAVFVPYNFCWLRRTNQLVTL